MLYIFIFIIILNMLDFKTNSSNIIYGDTVIDDFSVVGIFSGHYFDQCRPFINSDIN